jgi:ABC-2 type transport system ATP-binding protein
VIECRQLTHAFGDRTVLHDVTFKVPKGAVFGFIGPNGAGKTTTIRILATLQAPTRGTALVGGIDVVEDPAAVRRIMGYMPDLAGVYDRITAGEYLDFFASAMGIEPSKRARTIDNVFELTEVGHLRDREVSALSKGQRQRLLLARTLLHDPEVLILDEPASDLDPRARIELRMLLAELGRMGKTIFLSSHILTELADMCTWIGILERGRLATAGPIEAVQAALRPGRRVKVTVLREAERVREVAARFSFVLGVERLEEAALDASGGGRFELHYEGDDWRLSEIVSALGSEGLNLIAVEPERRDLERIFMDVTRAATPGAPVEGSAS